ncbi:YggS family pyridoxal phosphate-dependent enzyme [Metabacillus halosaccharovorans]|uniref:Pyridoxal phosphate homeostasis protein n=1 Tax=Metabacillus halosaccharovorans TaxID=930124 RepID=A0ABT3DL27_9BACI|nr:YggS family pyridoxal phosphate-dependent enzyme [Metabacillus halosaccharovorans]MCV9887573.1 YggS family pyridoxal phosphate-dependent enzyme [Metabacillus halosaccharovorans]
MNIQDNYKAIQHTIQTTCQRVGRIPEQINVIAVTKYVSVQRAKAALEAGVRHLGENRDDGLNEKVKELGNDSIWHFIGSLQTRKVKNIIDKVDFIHSLDRLSLAKEIDKRSSKPMKCFVQVNASGEESKHGCSPEELVDFIQQLTHYQHIQVVGLMTMAPNTEDKEVIRNCFKKVRQLQHDVQALQLPSAPCHELSMGMSNDYEIAIEEGATYIRIGTSLVGNETGGV